MKPLYFERSVLSGISLLLMGCGGNTDRAIHKTADHPNVVLILTDDQGWGDLGINGNQAIQTPVVDQLARQGISFDRFFVSPVSAPTRASLLTGRDHLRTGVSWVTGRNVVLKENEVTIAEMLKASGYTTGCFGKWHNGEQYPNTPRAQGFDEFFGFKAGHTNRYFDPRLEHDGKEVQCRGYITDILTDVASDFIRNNKDHPFFCYIPYNAPHGPFQVPDRYFDRYKEKGFDDKTSAVYGMCENIDENVGRLTNLIDSLGLRENTILLYLTDNGPNGVRYNGGMKGIKASVDEGGSRVPLFIRYPGVFKEHRVVKEISAHIDIFPTLMELCHVKIPDSLALDGRSLVPLMKGEKINWPDRKLFTYQDLSRDVLNYAGAVRTSRYRLVFRPKKDYMLYDMVEDPQQKNNIADSEPEIVKEMSEAYKQWFGKASHAAINFQPIQIGYDTAPVAELSAHEAMLSGGLAFRYKAGWNHDWITNWEKTEDSVNWEVKVVKKGDYKISLKYECPDKNLGSVIEISIGGQKIRKMITEPQEIKILEAKENRIPSSNSNAEWRIAEAGRLSLDQGIYPLKLKAIQIPGNQAIDLKSVIIEAL